MNIYKTAATVNLTPQMEKLLGDIVKELESAGIDAATNFSQEIVPTLSGVFGSLLGDAEAITSLGEKLREGESIESIVEEALMDNTDDGDIKLRDIVTKIIEEFSYQNFLNEAGFNSLKSNIKSFISNLSEVKKEVTTTPTVTPDVRPQPEIKTEPTKSFEQKTSELTNLIINPGVTLKDKAGYLIDNFSPEDLEEYLTDVLSSYDKSDAEPITDTPPSTLQLNQLIRSILDNAKQYEDKKSDIYKEKLLKEFGLFLLYNFGSTIQGVGDSEIIGLLGSLKKPAEVESQEQPVITEEKASEIEKIVEEDSEDIEDEDTADEEERIAKEKASRQSTSLNESNAFKFNLEAQNRFNRQKQNLGSYNSPFIDFPSGLVESIDDIDPNLPALDESTLLSFTSSLQSKLIDMFKQFKLGAQRGKAAVSTGGKGLNDLMFSVKQADSKTFKSLNDYLNKIKTFPPSESREAHILKVESIKQTFEQSCMSTYLLRGSEFNTGVEDEASPLFMIMLIALSETSPAILKLFSMKEAGAEVDLSAERDSYLTNYFRSRSLSVRTEDFDDVVSQYNEALFGTFSRKLTSFLSFSYTGNFSNFLSYVNLSHNNIINIALRNIFKISREYEMKPCPVCYKIIPVQFTSDANDSSNFRVSVVAPFRRSSSTGEYSSIDNSELAGKRFKITNKYIRNFSPKVSSELVYSEEGEDKRRSQESAAEYRYLNELLKNDSGATWEDIQSLVSSSYIDKQREGWHRRASALLELGGVQLTKQRIIKDLLVRCPVKPVSNLGGPNASSYCGAKIAPVQSDVLSPRISFQAQFNGQFRSPNTEVDTPASIPSGEIEATPDLSNAVRGGYKFSSFSFACPCRIQNPKREDIQRHRNVVFIKDLSNIVYPTTPEGSEDRSLPPGTVSFMVCGAPTSISSFNRNESESDKFILEVLLSTAQKSTQDYYKFLTYLVDNGLDPMDAMTLDADLKRYIKKKESLQATSSDEYSVSIKDRIKKISQIISRASTRRVEPGKKIGVTDVDSFINTLDNLSLVCPFGHRFNVGQSRRFGRAHSSYSSRSIYSNYSALVLTTGEKNAEAVMKSNILKAKPRGFKEDAWSSEHSQESSITYTKQRVGGRIDVADIEGGRSDQESAGSAIDSQGETTDDDQEISSAMKERGARQILPGEQLPGTEYLKLDLKIEELDYRPQVKRSLLVNRQANFIKETKPKFNALISIIKKTLSLINTYTHGVVSDSVALLNALRGETLRLDEILAEINQNYKGEIYKVISNARYRSPELDQDISVGEHADKVVDKIIEVISEEMLNILSYVVKASQQISNLGLDKKNVESEIDRFISFNIVKHAVSTALQDLIANEVSEIEDLTPDEQEKFVDQIVNQLLLSKNFINYLIRDTWDKAANKFDNVFTSRLITVSYAINIAKGISVLYSKYFNSNRLYDYLGFELGIDLTSPEVLLNASSANQVAMLISRIPNNFDQLLVTQSSDVFPTKASGTEPYPIRMDKFYQELLSIIEISRQLSSTPQKMIDAVSFIKSKVSSQLRDPEQIRNTLKNLTYDLPMFNFRLVSDYSNDDPEATSYRSFPNRNRLPFFSEQPSAFQNFSTKESWVCTVGGADYALRYLPPMPRFQASNKTEAEAFKQQGEKILDEYFAQTPKPPGNIARSSVRYDIIRDNYIVSNTLHPTVVAIKTDSQFEPINDFMGTIPYGKNFFLKVSNVPTNYFGIKYVGPSGDEANLNINKVSADIEINAYIVAVSLPEEFKSGLNSPKFEIFFSEVPGQAPEPINNNFNSSKVQIGTIRKKNKNNTYWPNLPPAGKTAEWSNYWNALYRGKDIASDFSDTWSYAGIILPIVDYDPETTSPSVSKAKDSPCLNYRVHVDFEGSPLDITPLILRGNVPVYKEQVEEYEKWQLEGSKGKAPRVSGDINEIHKLENDILEYMEDLEKATDEGQRYLIQEKINEASNKIKTFGMKIATSPSYIQLSNNGQIPAPKDGKKIYSGGKKGDLCNTITPQLVNPFHAFRIINNPAIAGANISPADQERLKKFIVGVYNLQPLINYLNTFDYNITADDLFDEKRITDLTDRMFTTKIKNKITNQIESKAKSIAIEIPGGKTRMVRSAIEHINHFIETSGWHEQPGQFYDIIPGSKDLNNGSYFQFLFNAEEHAGAGKVPPIKSYINSGVQTSAYNELFKRSSRSGLVQISNTLSSNSRNWITNPNYSVVGKVTVEEEGNEASDQMNKNIKDNKKVKLRRSKLTSMIDDAESRSVLLHGLE